MGLPGRWQVPPSQQRRRKPFPLLGPPGCFCQRKLCPPKAWRLQRASMGLGGPHGAPRGPAPPLPATAAPPWTRLLLLWRGSSWPPSTLLQGRRGHSRPPPSTSSLAGQMVPPVSSSSPIAPMKCEVWGFGALCQQHEDAKIQQGIVWTGQGVGGGGSRKTRAAEQQRLCPARAPPTTASLH